MLLVTTEGDARARGVQVGRKAGDLIRRNVGYYYYLWKRYSPIDREWVLKEASKFAEEIENYDPEIMAEIRGVADGAGLPVGDVVALNSRYEFVWAKIASDTGLRLTQAPECTALGAVPTGPGSSPLIGQNWDYKPRCTTTASCSKRHRNRRPPTS